jgi:hypothetical protein
MRVGTLLLRGMAVGLVAGLLAFGFAKLFGEPQVDKAIAFEAQMAQAKGETPEPEIISRATQAGPGLFTSVMVYSAAIGGLYALVFAFAYGRVGDLSPRALAALLALGGFIAIVLVPEIKYPANPPSIGQPETIGPRTALFFGMLAISLATLALAIASARQLAVRLGAWNAVLVAAAGFTVVIAIAQYALPDVNEVPSQFSAVVLWRFRIAALGLHAVLWTVLGLLFGALVERDFAQAGWRPRQLARNDRGS